MHYGYRIVEDMAEGLDNWMREKGFETLEDFRGLSLNRVTEWKHLNLNYKIVARIDEQKCIGCDLCHIACWDGAHQCIHLDRVTGPVDGHVELHRTPAAKEAESRAAIAETPVTRKERAAAGGDGAVCHAARADSARGRDGVRGLQFVLVRLPGGWLHHDGGGGHGAEAGDVGRAHAGSGVRDADA